MTQVAAVSGAEQSSTIGAIVTICSSRKRIAAQANAAALSKAPQAELAAAWRDRLGTLPRQIAAQDLYGGRAFGLAKSAAADAGTAFFIISAGLGLVPGPSKVPSYDLTVSERRASIASLAECSFDPTGWFRALNGGPFGVSWDAVFGPGQGCVLVALSRPYARMVGADLADLDPTSRARVRLFGIGIGDHIPAALQPALMPYDARLDAIKPGTKADFAQRALADFASHIAPFCSDASSEWHADAVRARLKDLKAPERPERPRRSDAELEALIRARLRKSTGIQRTLRALRDEDGVACEQSRFRRLYWKVMAAEGFS